MAVIDYDKEQSRMKYQTSRSTDVPTTSYSKRAITHISRRHSLRRKAGHRSYHDG